jgi:hypothetical protein
MTRILNLKEAIAYGLADRSALAALPEIEVLEAKAVGSVRFLGLELKAVGVDKQARSIRYAASVEVVDRMGDLIVQAGWDVKQFIKAGGPFFWAHQSWEPPVGAVRTSEIGATTIGRGVKAPALIQDVHYLGAEVSELGELAYRMASGDGMPGGKPVAKGVSVGFIGRSSRRPSEDEQKQLSMPGFGLIFERQEQLELSQAPVPANPYALPVAAEKSLAVKAVDERAARRRVAEALAHLVGAGLVKSSTAALFRSTYGLTPDHRLELARARVKSFHDVGEWVWDPRAKNAKEADEAERASREEAELDEADGIERDADAADEELDVESQAAVADDVVAAPDAAAEAAAPKSVEIGAALTKAEIAAFRTLHEQARALVGLLGETLGRIEERAASCATSDPAVIMSKALARLDEATAEMAELRASVTRAAPTSSTTRASSAPAGRVPTERTPSQPRTISAKEAMDRLGPLLSDVHA